MAQNSSDLLSRCTIETNGNVRSDEKQRMQKQEATHAETRGNAYRNEKQRVQQRTGVYAEKE